MSDTDASNATKSNGWLVNCYIVYSITLTYYLNSKWSKRKAIDSLFVWMCLICGFSSVYCHQVVLPECDFHYIANNLRMKYNMNDDDARNCVSELEHFYTGIKHTIVDSMIDHPQTAIKTAWEVHITHTSMYFNFTHSTFGTYVHYKPMSQEKGQLHVFHKLKTFGINNMNETVWLFKALQHQEYYSSPESWNNYYKESNIVPSFNQKVNKFLKKFLEEHNPSSHRLQALDIAMGQGRNSIWLARKGYNVTGFDSSSEGIQIAKKHAEQLNLTTLHAYVADIEEFEFGFERWDLIVCMYYPIVNETNYLRRIEQSLKPQGLLIVEVFHWDGLVGEHTIPIDVTYKTNAIPSLFSNLTIIRYEEPIDDSDFGNQPTKIIRYVGQKQYSHTWL